MAMLFSPQVNKKEANRVDLLLILKQAEAGTHSDKLLIEIARKLLKEIPDRLVAPNTPASIECDRQIREEVLKLDNGNHPFKPK